MTGNMDQPGTRHRNRPARVDRNDGYSAERDGVLAGSQIGQYVQVPAD